VIKPLFKSVPVCLLVKAPLSRPGHHFFVVLLSLSYFELAIICNSAAEFPGKNHSPLFRVASQQPSSLIVGQEPDPWLNSMSSFYSISMLAPGLVGWATALISFHAAACEHSIV